MRKVTEDVTVSFSTTDDTATTADNDYASTSGTVTIPAGSTTATVIVPVNGDTTVEPDEILFVTLANPVNANLGNTDGVGTIENDDAPVVSIDSPSVVEGNAGTADLVYTVSLDQPSTEDVTVEVTTTDATATTADGDYVTTTEIVTIPAGLTEATFTVPVNGDTTVEPDETVTATLSAPTNATLDPVASVGTGTIINDDGAALSIDDVTLVEGDAGTTNAMFTVSIDNPSTQDITVDYVITDDTATSADADYVPVTGTATIPAGSTSTTIDVPVTGDTTVETDETFTVDLSNPTNATIADNQGVGTIENDDAPTVSISDATVVEGDAGTADLVYTVSLDQPSTEDVTVEVTTTDGTATTADGDYVATTETIVIPAGSTEATFTVPVNGDTTVETDESVTATLSG